MIYTITPDLLENITDGEGCYFTDILFVFTIRSNSLKVALDKDNEVLSIYRDIKKNAETIKTWLDLMSFSPSPFEKINITIANIDCIEEKFIRLCKETKGGNKLIVYSMQNISKFECQEKSIIFEDVPITVLDKDDAKVELNSSNAITNIITSSQIAMGNSSITDSNNR